MPEQVEVINTDSATDFLCELIPGLDKKEVAADTILLDDYYDDILNGLDDIRPLYQNAGDQRLISLFQVIVEAHRQAKPAEEALSEQQYEFKSEDLPFIISYASSWIRCNVTVFDDLPKNDILPEASRVAPLVAQAPPPEPEPWLESEPSPEPAREDEAGTQPKPEPEPQPAPPPETESEPQAEPQPAPPPGELSDPKPTPSVKLPVKPPTKRSSKRSSKQPKAPGATSSEAPPRDEPEMTDNIPQETTDSPTGEEDISEDTSEDFWSGVEEDDAIREDQGGYSLVSIYVKQAGKAPLLSAAEEVELAEKIEAGLFAQEKLDKEGAALQTANPQLYHDLGIIARQGHAAKERLIASNLRLAISLARRYIWRDLPFLDLIQLANVGLMRAVEKFDFKKGYKFSTYATWWIKQAVTRGIADEGRTIRFPVHYVDAINRLNVARRDMGKRLLREPTMAELAKELDLSEEKIEMMMQDQRSMVSLDFIKVDTDESTLHEVVPDIMTPDAGDQMSQDYNRSALNKSVNTGLSKRESFIVQSQFRDDPKPLPEVARALRVTVPDVRRSLSQALAKLSHPSTRLDEALDMMIGKGEWRASARCSTGPNIAFFPLNDKLADTARRTCGECLVARFCLTYALENRIVSGVWGGSTPSQRSIVWRDAKPQHAAQQLIKLLEADIPEAILRGRDQYMRSHEGGDPLATLKITGSAQAHGKSSS